jgi:hypothetical protein
MMLSEIRGRQRQKEREIADITLTVLSIEIVLVHVKSHWLLLMSVRLRIIIP